MNRLLVLLLLLTACSSDDDAASAAGTGGTGGTSGTSGTSGVPDAGAGPTGDGPYFGAAHSGNFWLGPVDYAESEWHNACAPSVKYPTAIQRLYGNYIMGLANEVVLDGLKASDGQLCDTCVELTANGKTFVARAVTFGQETGPNDIDVSPELDMALDSAAGRNVSWRFTTCPTSAPVTYTFDGRQWDNVYFFRVWVRNARIPISKVEYRLGTGSWAAADEQGDGAWQASNEDFSGGFSLRVTGIDGQTLEDELPGLSTFDPNVGVSSHANFD